MIQHECPDHSGWPDHRLIRVAANPTASRTTNGRAAAFVGEAVGCCAPGTDSVPPGTCVVVSTSVPEREPMTLHPTSTLITPVLPFSLREIIAVRKRGFIRLAGVGRIDEHRGTLLYGHMVHEVRCGIVHLVGYGNNKISTILII